nr:integrase, catalytic region, zinc finger, CCHC-type, peptidase aspartic, catalytic [Tanacetum cinerariifolium]
SNADAASLRLKLFKDVADAKHYFYQQIPKQQSQDKGNGIMIEEPIKPKKKDQIRLDEEAAKRLQAEFDEEESLDTSKDLKLKEFDKIQEMFNRLFKRVSTFEDIRTELVKGKDKRAREEIIQENEEEVAIDAIPLAVKSPKIVDWKIHKEGKKIYYQMVKNNRKTYEYYLKHNIEQAAILREVVEQAKSRNPLDSASYSACIYVMLIQELLGYVRDTCLDIHKPNEKVVAVMPINKTKIVQFAKTAASSSNIPKATYRPLLPSTGVKPSTSASGSKPSGNTKTDRILQTPSSNEKNKVEVKSRKVKSKLNNRTLILKIMNVHDKSSSKKNKKRKELKPTGKVFNSVGYKWKPTGRTFTLVGNACPLGLPPLIKMELDTSQGSGTSLAPSSSSLIICRFGNDRVVKIMGYGDYHIRNVTISSLYYVEGLGHNLFLVGQFYDSDLEVV